MSNKTQLEFYCTRWGSENIPWEVFINFVKASGYDGIEYGIVSDASPAILDHVWNLASKQGLKMIPHHYDTVTTEFSRHQQQFEAWFELVSAYEAEKINVQSGRDCFDFAANEKLIRFTEGYQKSKGVQVVHETHRQRCLFAAHVAREFLEKIPSLRLTLDISHWVCVAETFLGDQTEAVNLALQRTEHVHARVGYPQGPQISDPRAPEWESALATHLNWWRAVAKQLVNLNKTLTITPEFGPPPYMPCHPYTGQPCANQWEVNLYMMNLLRHEL
ncbi:MAG TPA: TIM barrel protein [Cellvibrio sp.]|nr:TIM barrel protein [Cellvibrio sp.]